MASANALRSLVRPTISRAPRIQPVMLSLASAASPAPAQAASFSTGSPLAASAAPPPIKSRRDLPKQTKKTYKKKQTIVPFKRPAPGERKAFRKRIQLSNDSALPVPGLDTLQPESMARGESAGKMFGIPDRVVDRLRALQAFKPTQTWNLFRKPHFLVRKQTVELISKIEATVEKKEALRCILSGPKDTGKSLTLLQAMSYALMNEWVVIHLPEGHTLVNGNVEYSPVPDTEPMQFTQPIYTFNLLQDIYRANRAVLEKLPVQGDWSGLTTSLRQGATLADLVLTAKESEVAWQTLNALWTELTQPGRPPVLLSLDGLSHISKMSNYRDPSFNDVHAHDLVLVRMFIDAISGKTALPNGGAVIAATSRSSVPFSPSLQLVMRQLEAGQSGERVPKPDPYERKYDDRVYDALKNCYILALGGLPKDEARVLMEYWAAGGLLRCELNSHVVAEKWALGGHGVIGEMERTSLMTMRM